MPLPILRATRAALPNKTPFARTRAYLKHFPLVSAYSADWQLRTRHTHITHSARVILVAFQRRAFGGPSHEPRRATRGAGRARAEPPPLAGTSRGRATVYVLSTIRVLRSCHARDAHTLYTEILSSYTLSHRTYTRARRSCACTPDSLRTRPYFATRRTPNLRARFRMSQICARSRFWRQPRRRW